MSTLTYILLSLLLPIRERVVFTVLSFTFYLVIYLLFIYTYLLNAVVSFVDRKMENTWSVLRRPQVKTKQPLFQLIFFKQMQLWRWVQCSTIAGDLLGQLCVDRQSLGSLWPRLVHCHLGSAPLHPPDYGSADQPTTNNSLSKEQVSCDLTEMEYNQYIQTPTGNKTMRETRTPALVSVFS